MAALATCPHLPREGAQFLPSLFFCTHLMSDCPYGSRLLAPLSSWGVRPASPFIEGASRGVPGSPKPPVSHLPLLVLGPFPARLWSLHSLLLPTGLCLKPPTPLCVLGATALSPSSLAWPEHLCWWLVTCLLSCPHCSPRSSPSKAVPWSLLASLLFLPFCAVSFASS